MKKHLPLLLALALGLVASLRAQTPAAAPQKSQADVDYDTIWTTYRAEAPAELAENSHERRLWLDKQLQAFSAAARAFGLKYPTDPRRYEGWVQASYTGPSFITGFDPQTGKGISDDAKVLAYRSEQVRLMQIVVEAADATPRQRNGGFNALMIDSGTVARMKGEKFDVTVFRPLVDRLVAQYPDERVLPVVQMYSGRLREQSPTDADAFMASLKDQPAVQAAIKDAEEKRRLAEEEKARKRVDIPSIKFTAADGRAVDIARLKGKVVLVDFWATWCGPCKAEIPNVVANYNKYHDKGFEVVGITLENPGFTPKDDEATKAAKLAKAKQVMLDFTAKAGMPWPQYFDGKWWKNDYSTKFGIDAIPAMFLLDQNGNIVSTEARGPKLEAEIKRLLKI